MKVDRRTFLAGSLGLAAGAVATTLLEKPKHRVIRKQPCPGGYPPRRILFSQPRNILHSGWSCFTGRCVKVSCSNPTRRLHSRKSYQHAPFLVSAAVECFRRLGAKSVLIGEGPGHQRDTELVLLESGFSEELRQLKVPFVDLNRDELVMTPLLATYTGMKHLWLPGRCSRPTSSSPC